MRQVLPTFIDLTREEDEDEYIIAIDIGVINFSYTIYNLNLNKFMGCKNQMLSLASKYEAQAISRVCINVGSELIEWLPTSIDPKRVTVLVEHQLVKAGTGSIHGKLVTLKSLETSIFTLFMAKGYHVKTMYPRRVAKYFQSSLNKTSRYHKKKSSILLVENLLASKAVIMSKNALLGWNTCSKKDDMADCVLMTQYYTSQ